MSGSRVHVWCPERGVSWVAGVEPARCTEPGHRHQRHEVHRHRDVVLLPDRTPVTAVSFDPVEPYARDRPPDFALYLDPRWRPGWPHDHHAWPDLGVPDDASAALAALAALLARARDGEQVEIGCLGGHGRTGTALAALAVLTGEDPRSAVAWVRARYCPMAVETAEQEEWVASLPPATG